MQVILSLPSRETGLRLEIIKPEEEARLAVISCAPLVSAKRSSYWWLILEAGQPS